MNAPSPRLALRHHDPALFTARAWIERLRGVNSDDGGVVKKTGARYREHARVVMQLNGGYTKITFERTHGSGMADGGIDWDVPTERIPRHLRAIGSRFVFVFEPAAPEKDESADSIRSCRDDFFVIEEISALA